ncbi:MAG: arylamine N-acetyltransferase [Candidatus Promineifilaceae bacterium]|nr:arylamine N-acetyltransferase [Candidatus Promineifilaceae bacterium]
MRESDRDKVISYLERINYHGALTPAAPTLRQLQLAHLYTVPFENLSIHWGEAIVLDDAALYEKVVERRRGGFCYELNGLFAWLLRALGFDVTRLAANVANDNRHYSPDFDHMALLVNLEHPWLVDVGFGDTFREPLRLDIRTEQQQQGGSYRIRLNNAYYVLEEKKPGQDWEKAYRFTLQGYAYSDFQSRCRFHETSPESHFKRRRICSRATPAGRITLSDKTLITSSLYGQREEQEAQDDGQYRQLLKQYFGISAVHLRYF